MAAALLGTAACGSTKTGTEDVTAVPTQPADFGKGEEQGGEKKTDGGKNGAEVSGQKQENDTSGRDDNGKDSGTVITEGTNSAQTPGAVSGELPDKVKEQISLIRSAAVETSKNKAVITLSDAGIKVDGDGCKVDGSELKIKEAGTYTISGALSNGCVIVNADAESEVVLVLNGISVHNETGAALYCKKAAKVTVVLADGTKNVLSDGGRYVFEEGEDEPDAALFAKHDLVITGAGALEITSKYKDALKGKDALYILGGDLTIDSADDGITGRDLLYVADGKITVNSAADALKSTNDKDGELGLIVIDGGSFLLNAGEDAIQAENTLFIQDGTFEIKTGKGADGAATKGGNDRFGGKGDFGGWGRGEGAAQQNSEETVSAKGLKASAKIVLNGGSFSIDTEDDAIHGNEKVYVLGGNYTIKAGDDGLHADEELIFANNPSVSVLKSYEGLESKTITVNGGKIDVTASDDGVNAAGGMDNSGFGGKGMFSSGQGQLIINGGTLTVNAGGDGLDANGSITMNGGTVVVYGPTDNGNGALDYDGSFALNGGSLLCIGSSGMAQAPSASSAQFSLAAGLTQTAAAGSTVEIVIDGKTVFRTTSPKQFSYIVASSSDFSKDNTAKVLVNGEELFAGTLTSVVTNFGNTAGGFGGFGGGRNPMDGENGMWNGRPNKEGNGMWGDRSGMERNPMPDGGMPQKPDGGQQKVPSDRLPDDNSGKPMA